MPFDWINSSIGVFVFLSAASRQEVEPSRVGAVSVHHLPVSWSGARRADVELRKVDAVVVQILLLLQTLKFEQQVTDEDLKDGDTQEKSFRFQWPLQARLLITFQQVLNYFDNTLCLLNSSAIFLWSKRKSFCFSSDVHVHRRLQIWIRTNRMMRLNAFMLCHTPTVWL